jgi:hypothetical protein
MSEAKSEPKSAMSAPMDEDVKDVKPEEMNERIRATYETPQIREANERYHDYHEQRRDFEPSEREKVTLKERVSSGVVMGNVGDTFEVSKMQADQLKQTGVVDAASGDAEVKSYRGQQNKDMREQRLQKRSDKTSQTAKPTTSAPPPHGTVAARSDTPSQTK